MVRITQYLLKRGWLRFPGQDPESFKHIKHGPVKWRDYKSPFVEPPYWYKWSLESPYSPVEQRRIRAREDVGWYKHNYSKIKITSPDQWLFLVGDKVEVLAGKDKGKQGEVVQIVPQRNWVVVGRLNLKHELRGDEVHAVPQPFEHDELSLVDPKDNKATEIEFKADRAGALVRVSKRSGHIIPRPLELLHDRTPKERYVDQEKDTEQAVALERTYVPSMKSPEEELRELYKINDPPRKKTFWY